MNPSQVANTVPQPDAFESTGVAASRRSASRAKPAARLRYAMLLGVALILTTLTLVARNSIRETEAELDIIQATLLSLPLSLDQPLHQVTSSDSVRAEY